MELEHLRAIRLQDSSYLSFKGQGVTEGRTNEDNKVGGDDEDD